MLNTIIENKIDRQQYKVVQENFVIVCGRH